MSFMNETSEVVGKIRSAATTVSAAANIACEVWEAGEAMLTPQKVKEVEACMREIAAALERLSPVVDNFARVAGQRKPN